MSSLDVESAVRRQPLSERIHFNSTLEDLALRRISDRDLAGARAAFAMLLERLDPAAEPGRDREVVLLLLDLLHQTNRKLYGRADRARYESHRLALLEHFASCQDAREARAIFLALFDRLVTPLGGKTSRRHPLVERALAVVEEHYQRRLSLSIVAAQLRVSANYLSRLFRRETGNTLTSHIHRVRLEHALLLLASGGRNLAEIAQVVGYPNYRDFYRNFMKHEKASPRQVQQRLSLRA